MSKPQLSLAKELYELHSNKLATQYTPKRRHKSIDDTKKMLNEWMKYWNNNDYGYFIFIEKESGNVIDNGGAKKWNLPIKNTLIYIIDWIIR